MQNLNINVILVEPRGPINIGNVARLCKNYDVNELRLVSPKCDPLNDESKKMSVKGVEYLATNNIFTSLNEAIYDCNIVIASCGRIDRGETLSLVNLDKCNKWLAKLDCKSNKVALIFGREDRGLTNAELLLADKVIMIESSIKYLSLNLSHSVSIVLHSIFSAQQKLKSFEKSINN